MTVGVQLRRWPVACLVIGLAACGPIGSEPAGPPEANSPAAVSSIESTPVEQGETYGSLTLAASRFTHPSMSFSVDPPEGWPVEVHDTGATWTDPAGEGRIDIRVNPTGYQLDETYLDNFIQAIEEHSSEERDGYRVLDQAVDDTGARVVTQSLSQDGVPFQVVSVYVQDKDVVYDSEFWMSESSVDGYMPAYEQIWQGMVVSSERASASVEPYTDVYTFNDSDGLFSLDVPRGWHLDVYTQPDAVADTFWAPDRLARIEIIKYDDGTEISKALAGSFALDLLHQRYSEDAKITQDRVQPDGGERLTWSSKSGDVAGASFFETRGTTFLMLTYLCDDSVDYVYAPVLERLLQSYSAP
jgi:hypothetical protein